MTSPDQAQKAEAFRALHSLRDSQQIIHAGEIGGPEIF
jgi:hypothetical protein